jgi:nucleoside-diphosphate-sugar epimerase
VAARPVAAITGASGYLGSRICAALESQGWRVVRLVRSPSQGQGDECAYDLGALVSSEVCELLGSTDVLIHTAYDLALTRAADIWRVNVEGTRRLLQVASDAGVRRILVLSSMSAYEGTTQLYGRAKLDIEALTAQFGGCSVRPGLVYGEQSGGMAGALRRFARLPVVPLIAGDARIYTVSEDDLMTAISAFASADTLPAVTISAAHPVPVPMRDLMTVFAARGGANCRFVKVPWKPVYGLLRAAESVGLHLPFRADSLLGLVHGARHVVNQDMLGTLGVTFREFDSSRS